LERYFWARIETAPNPPKDSKAVRTEIKEMTDALEAFRTAVEAGEVTGFQNGSMHARGGTCVSSNK
jgi:hypothetical protein